MSGKKKDKGILGTRKTFPPQSVMYKGKSHVIPPGYLRLDTSYPFAGTMLSGAEIVALKKDMSAKRAPSKKTPQQTFRRKKGGAPQKNDGLPSPLTKINNKKTERKNAIVFVGSSAADARAPMQTEIADISDKLSGQNGKIPVVYALQDVTLWGICNSMISFALCAGYRQENQGTALQNSPWLAANYLYNTLLNVVQGKTYDINTIKVPLWLRDLVAAITPKSNTVFNSGSIQYAWTLKNPNALIGPNQFYPTFQGSNYFYYANDTTALGYAGCPVMSLTSVAYTSDLGAAAWENLVTYFEKVANTAWKGEYKPWSKVDMKIEDSPLQNSNAAFAFVSQVWGVGQQGGFVSSLASSQVYNQHPKFSRFVDPTQKVVEGYRNHKAISGDTNSLFGEMMLQYSAKEYSNKSYMVFKYIDFFEIADRILRAMMVSLSIAKVTTFTPFFEGSEYLIMLHAILMKGFRHNYIGQTLWPYYTKSPSDFNPFLSNCATVSGEAYLSMTLPLFICENLKALLPRAVFPDKLRNGNINKNSIRWYMPILGQYNDNEFDFKSYTYTDPGGATQFFFTGPGDAINLVDGTNQNNNDVLDIANAQAIDALTRKWNNFMTLISAAVQQPASATFDPAINALQVITMTNVVEQIMEKVIDSDEEKEKKKSKKKTKIKLMRSKLK